MYAIRSYYVKSENGRLFKQCFAPDGDRCPGRYKKMELWWRTVEKIGYNRSGQPFMVDFMKIIENQVSIIFQLTVDIIEQQVARNNFV